MKLGEISIIVVLLVALFEQIFSFEVCDQKHLKPSTYESSQTFINLSDLSN